MKKQETRMRYENPTQETEQTCGQCDLPVTEATTGVAGKMAAAAAGIAGKSITAKIVAVIVAATLVAGGGIGISKAYDYYKQVQIEKQYAVDEQTILNAIDKPYLENLLCFLPVFDENNPIEDRQFQFLIDYSLAHEGFNRVNTSLDLPTVLEDAKGIECDIREGSPKPLRSISAPVEPFVEAARLMRYDVEITEDYIKQYDPTGYVISFKDGRLHYAYHYMGMTNFSWESEITGIANGGGQVVVSYELYFSNWTDGTKHRESRAAWLIREGDGYVIEKVEILTEPDGVLGIMETVDL